MTSDQLAIGAGILLSLFFSYIPGLNDWYNKLDATRKRLIMLAALVVVSCTAFGFGCWPAFPVHVVTCDAAGAWGLATAFFGALVANQTTYLITPKPARFEENG